MQPLLELTALTSTRDFRAAYRGLRDTLSLAIPRSFPDFIIRTPGGGGKGACWFEDYQFWAHPSIEASGSRYWNVFGIRSPAEVPKQVPVCEICPPRVEVNLRLSGAFAADADGHWYYLHSGKFGGHYAGVASETFMRRFSGQQATVTFPTASGTVTRLMCVVGRLGDLNFTRHLAAFVHAVARFKEQVLAGTLAPPPLTPDVADVWESTVHEAVAQGAFDPQNVQDARERTLAAIVRRQGQPQFRQRLLKAYGGRCALSGCDAPEALEAAHIIPFQGHATHHVANGLLLRADLHTLFDLGLLAVDPDTCQVLVADSLMHTTYASLAGAKLRWPAREEDRPSREALAEHRRKSGL